MENALANARVLSRALEVTGWYRCVSDIHRKNGDYEYNREQAMQNPYEEGDTSEFYNAGLPVVAFTLSDEFKQKFPHVKQVAVSNLLRAKQYIVPSKLPSILIRYASLTRQPTDYPLPPNEDKTEILRVVVRESMSMDLLDRLIADLCSVTENLMESDVVDLAAWQPFSKSFEKEHSSAGVDHKNRSKAKQPMHKGIHRSVC
jgi:glutamate decarboxylase